MQIEENKQTKEHDPLGNQVNQVREKNPFVLTTSKVGDSLFHLEPF